MIKFFSLALCLCCLFASGCLSSINYQRLASAGLDAAKAATVDEKDLAQTSLQMRKQMDTTSEMAPENSPYTKRLRKLMANEKSVNGVPLNYRVYMSPDLNANATPDGSIRVNSGIMDAMNDDEVRFVVGHEIGHVANGDSLNALRMVYTTAAARKAGGALHQYAALADAAVGDLAQDFVNAQYSQHQELNADAYGVNFLKKNHYNVDAAVSAMRKLGVSGGGFFDSHPSNEKRLQNIEALKNGADPNSLSTDK